MVQITKAAHAIAAKHLEGALSLLALDMHGLAIATYERLGGHGLPAQRKAWMVAEYGATCAWCGNDFPSIDLQLGHLIPASACTPGVRGHKRGGYVPANIALTCKPCNIKQDDEWADPWDMARPDLVPLVWLALSWRNPLY